MRSVVSWLASTSAGRLFAELAPWLIVLLIVAAVGGVAIAMLRRKTQSDGNATGQDFTLQGLRDLHAQGMLSDEEFARAKQSMIERVRAATSENTGDEDAGNHPDSGA